MALNPATDFKAPLQYERLVQTPDGIGGEAAFEQICFFPDF